MTYSLKGEKRTAFGKQLSALREKGLVPAVVYGPKEDAFSVSVALGEFKKVWKSAGESSIVTLSIDGVGSKDVLIHEVDTHPVSGEPVHVDFYAIEAGKKIEVGVPLVFTGLAPAVKTYGATLVKVLYELEIAALPKDLPHEISVDVSSLAELDSQIHAKDIKLPSGVELVTDGDEVVAAVSEQVVEEEAFVAPADLSAIEVEKKGKKEEALGGDSGAPAGAPKKEAGKK